MRSLKLAQCLSHLPQQLLLLRFSELPHHASGQPACCRLQESIERSVMGLKWKSTGDDLVKASFGEFPLKDSWIGESKGIRSVRGRSSRICCHNGKRQGKERIVFRCRPDQCRKFPTRFEDSSYLSERELPVRDEHQSKTADDRIEGIVLQVKMLCIHDACGESGQPLKLRNLRSYVEHFRRDIGCQNGAARSHSARREYTLIPGACRNVQDVISRHQSRRF